MPADLRAPIEPDHVPAPVSTVLVVDDDPLVRTVVRRHLEGSGYLVREAVSGRNALALLREADPVLAVVTDLRMSDGSGGWLLAQLAYEHPRLLPRVLIMSGDASGASAAHVSVRWRCPVLAKPFTATELVNAVARITEHAA